KGLTADIRTVEGHLALSGQMATTVTFERIEDGPNRGQDRLVRYTNASGQPKPFFGSFAERMEYDRHGLLEKIVFLGPDDKPMMAAGGFVEVRIRRNEAGSPLEFAMFDGNGNPVRAKNRVARTTLTYDVRGNQLREGYFDETGTPIRNVEGY